MKFLDLSINNFLTIGSANIRLDDRGLNLLQGQNDDDPSAESNGAGKSSIGDALCWALFGETARGEGGDAIVNQTAKKECVVGVDFRDGDTRYRVTRHRKHSKFKNALHFHAFDDSGTLHDLSKGTDKETQGEIERTLGCSYEVFRSAIYAGQEQMPDLPNMTDKPLKMLIEQAAGIERLERAYELARSQEAEVQRIVRDATTQREAVSGEISRQSVNLETAKLRAHEFEQQREGIAKAHVDRAEQFRTEATEWVAKIKEVPEAKLNETLGKLQDAVGQIDLKRKAADDHSSGALRKSGIALQAEEQKLLLARNAVVAAKVRYDNAHKELEKPCPECGKPHTAEELDTLRGALRKQVEQRASEYRAIEALIPPLREAYEQEKKQQEELRAAIPDVSKLIQQRSEIETKLREIQSWKNKAQLAVQAAQQAAKDAETARTATNPHQGVVDMCAQSVDAAKQKLAEIEAKLVTATADLEVAQQVTKVFSPAGVRAHILDTVTPFLNQQTAEYLSTLSDGNLTATWSTLSKTAKGELREKFSIDVEHAKGGKSFGLISGGEKRKVRLATMLALQDLVAARATKPIDLWIGDEIDDALDDSGRERLMVLLERKARERGTVLIISHSDLSSFVDEVTLVTKNGGFSTISGSLCRPK